MRSSTSCGPFVRVALLSATALLAPLVAHAAAQRTFVASYGNDVNVASNCSLAAPCRSFTAAISVANPGGEVVILDTAGYGPMTINKSLKVIGPSGVYGGISVLGGANPTTGIVINAGDTDDVTLRGLDVSGVPGTAPLPDVGIDIQNAGAVHIEKSSVGNFTQDTSACVRVNVAKTIRVFVEDSFLRECNTSFYANSTVAGGNKPSVALDNVRIERGKNTGGAGGLVRGVWMQGYVDVALRNVSISRQDVGIQVDGLPASLLDRLTVNNTQISRTTTGVLVTGATAGGNAQIVLVDSQVVQGGDGLIVNVPGTSSIGVRLFNSHVAGMNNKGITLAVSGAGAQSQAGIELANASVTSTGTAIDVSAVNGSTALIDVRDTTLNDAATLVKTSGSASELDVALMRSNMFDADTAIDHGYGTVVLNGSQVNLVTKDFVNSGSGTIVSNGQNMVYNVDDPAGPTYITPSIIPLK